MTIEALEQLENDIDHSHITVATTTFYPNWHPGQAEEEPKADKLRGDLALEFAARIVEQGYGLAVVDGGSNETFLAEMGRLAKVSGQTERGMSGSRRQAFGEAVERPDCKIIIWSEPEKVEFAQSYCLRPCYMSIARGEYDIVVPGRTNDGYNSLPTAQARMERHFARRWSSLLRISGMMPKDAPDFDIAFGPRIFRNDPDIVSLFMDRYQFDFRDRIGVIGDEKVDLRSALEHLYSRAKPDTYPNTTFFPIIAALHHGIRVGNMEVPYLHPPVQTRMEEGNSEFDRKRWDQYLNIVLASIHFIRYLRNDPRSLIQLQ